MLKRSFDRQLVTQDHITLVFLCYSSHFKHILTSYFGVKISIVT